LLKGFRDALTKIGMKEAEAKQYVFHSWRHFFATHLSGKLDAKLLQQQTGHKTRAMLEHYANHRTQADEIAVQTAQKSAFAFLLEDKKAD
jgi:integrase